LPGQTDGLRREVRPLGPKMLWATALALYSADAMLYAPSPSSGCDRKSRSRLANRAPLPARSGGV